MVVGWLTAFLDRPASRVGAAVDFWTRVTGTTRSPVRGERGEFATFRPDPDDGDAYLRVQTVLDGPGGGHLDVHVADPLATVPRAVDLGAGVRWLDGYATLISPAGLRWCLVPERGVAGSTLLRPAPVRRDDGVRSLVDQLCLDVPPAAFETECAFWTAFTGWPLRAGPSPQVAVLDGPEALPLRLALRKLAADPVDGVAGCHLDLATSDVEREVARHLGWGARVA